MSLKLRALRRPNFAIFLLRAKFARTFKYLSEGGAPIVRELWSYLVTS
jgi:hypothetical protein